MLCESALTGLGWGSARAVATVDQALALIDAQVFDASFAGHQAKRPESYPVADALATRGVPFAFSTGYASLGKDSTGLAPAERAFREQVDRGLGAPSP
jgi:hypothetical protein